MANTKLLRAATLDRIGDLVDDTVGVHLRDLPPFTTLLVWTINSLYRVVVTEWPEIYVQGSALFPDPTLAYVDGARFGGSCLRVGLISAGLFVEIRSGGRRIITSPSPRHYHRAGVELARTASGPYSLKYYQFDAPGCDRPSGSASVLCCSDGYIDESCGPGRRRR